MIKGLGEKKESRMLRCEKCGREMDEVRYKIKEYWYCHLCIGVVLKETKQFVEEVKKGEGK